MAVTRHLTACLCLLVLLGSPSNTAAMDTFNGQILGADGQPIALHGVNWFGFELLSTFVDGLWYGGTLTKDFAMVVHRMKLLGFNCVRLPFAFQNIFDRVPLSYEKDNCPAVLESELRASVLPPGSAPVGSDGPLPGLANSPTRGINKCNDYIPGSSGLARMVWTVSFLASNGFYVVLDNQFQFDESSIDDPVGWRSNWGRLMTAIAADPAARSHVIVDALNEPEHKQLGWNARNGKPGYGAMLLDIMDIVHPICPDALFLVEGTGQTALAFNWGDGLATDPLVIARLGIDDPTPFFEAIMSKPYLSKVVLSPHLYGPTVSGNSDRSSGAYLFQRLSDSFGTKGKDGYCNAGGCHRFAIIIGEFGSDLGPADAQYFQDLALYLNNEGAGADGRHLPITSWLWWAWNANAGGSMGLTKDPTWQDLDWTKLAYLQGLGLRPWYRQTGGGTSAPTVVAPPAPKTTPAPAPVPIATPAATPAAPAATTPPAATSAPTSAATQAPATTGACSAKVSVLPSWRAPDGSLEATVEVTIKNLGSQAVAVPWDVALTHAASATISSTWNWQVTAASTSSWTGSATSAWMALQPGVEQQLGLTVVAPTTDALVPSGVSLNGAPCTMV